MEPNKLETEFRDKLEQRRIQPSEMAWDRLDAMLSVAENKKPEKDRKWLYVAAAFLVFLLVGVIFLNQENENNEGFINGNSVVNKESKPQIKEKNKEAVVIAEETTISQPQQVAAAGPKKLMQRQTKDGNKQGQAEVTKSRQVKDFIAPQPVQQAVAYENSPQGAEDLLVAATSQPMPKNKNTIKVDANSLLSSVEGELDDTYRSSVFQKAVKNFNVVKTAVANRNYQ